MTFSYFNSRPYTEGDLLLAENQSCRAYFNSRPLYRGRQRDAAERVSFPYFNSRPLYRGRQPRTTSVSTSAHFNSRPLYRGRREAFNLIGYALDISTHAPYTEGDSKYHRNNTRKTYFNSRPLYRGRRYDDDADYNTNAFQLTPPIQRATINLSLSWSIVIISTHAPYTEGDETGSANH